MSLCIVILSSWYLATARDPPYSHHSLTLFAHSSSITPTLHPSLISPLTLCPLSSLIPIFYLYFSSLSSHLSSPSSHLYSLPSSLSCLISPHSSTIHLLIPLSPLSTHHSPLTSHLSSPLLSYRFRQSIITS